MAAGKKKRTDVLKVKNLPSDAGSKAKDVKGGMLRAAGTDDKTHCCRTSCTHSHCTRG